jgi:flagellar hook-associated protein FlgK
MENDRTNERIVALTTAQKVTNDHLDQIDETLDALDKVIRGDYENSRDGLMARLHDLEQEIRKLNAVVFQDSTGKKGLVATVDVLVSGRMDSLERRKSNVSIIIAIITSVALVLTNLDRIGTFWKTTFGQQSQKKKHRKVIDSDSE